MGIIVMPRYRLPTVLDRVKEAYWTGVIDIDRLESDVAAVLASGRADEETVLNYPWCLEPPLFEPLPLDEVTM